MDCCESWLSTGFVSYKLTKLQMFYTLYMCIRKFVSLRAERAPLYEWLALFAQVVLTLCQADSLYKETAVISEV